MQKITPFLWFDGKVEEAMNFYVSVFKNSKVTTPARRGVSTCAWISATPRTKMSLTVTTYSPEAIKGTNQRNLRDYYESLSDVWEMFTLVLAQRKRREVDPILSTLRKCREALSPESLGGYYVPTNTGQLVPLSTIVSIETGTGPNSLTHYNQLNAATFSAVPMPGVTVGQAVDFLEGEAKKMPAGFSHDYLADSRQYVQEGNQLAITFGFALIIIFLVLAAQFESLRDPLVIMISVPMAIVGAMIPLFFGMATMNIYTQVGLLTLVGLISKHGILMVEFANELQLNEGLDRRSAIEMAARVRLRPILMTTAAMVTGLLPLLTATGAGAASRFSIGLVVVAGMSIGTLFTLFVLPAVYVAIATDHRANAESDRTKEIADFDLGDPALKPT
jgi:multidrug efflux pump